MRLFHDPDSRAVATASVAPWRAPFRRRPSAVLLAVALVATVLTVPVGPASAAGSPGWPLRGAPCPQAGSTRTSSGPSTVTRSPRVALIRNVQVQAGGCADVVEFLFWGGVPGWSVAYQRGRLRFDPSGRPARVPGRVHLVVPLSPASGTDPVTGAAVYGGPPAMRPARPSAVRGLRRLGDFEAVTTWAVGLPSRRPFAVRVASGRLVISVAAPSPRPRRCLLRQAHLRPGYPPGWFADLTPEWACGYFGPRPFPIVPNSDAFTWTETVETTTLPPAEVVAAALRNGGLRRRSTCVAGYPATVLDVTVPDNAPFLPAGYRYRLYVVAARPHTVLIQSVPVPPGPAVQRTRRAVDQVAHLTRRG